MKYTEAQKAAVKNLEGTKDLHQRIRDDFLKISRRVRIEKDFIILESSMNFKYQKRKMKIKKNITTKFPLLRGVGGVYFKQP